MTRDPRARRAAVAAQSRGWEVVGLSGTFAVGDEPAELAGVPVTRLERGRRTDRLRRTAVGALASSPERGVLPRELRGIYQLLRLASQSLLFVRAGRPLGRFDVVHANDLETLPAGWALARSARARLIYDAHELYTESEPDPPRIYRAVLGALERLLAKRASAVVTVSDDIADELVKRRRPAHPADGRPQLPGARGSRRRHLTSHRCARSTRRARAPAAGSKTSSRQQR